MLVLRRKLGETIVINDSIRITVTRVRPGRVRLAIDAPASVRIHRLGALSPGAPVLTAPVVSPQQTDMVEMAAQVVNVS